MKTFLNNHTNVVVNIIGHDIVINMAPDLTIYIDNEETCAGSLSKKGLLSSHDFING